MNTLKLSPLGESRFPDIPGLKFYEAEGGLLYFDTSHRLAALGPETGLSVGDFFTRFDFFVGTLCEALAVGQESLAVGDGNSDHVYLDECLIVPFLAYTERWFAPWMFLRVEELLRLGFTVNDDMARYLY
ncbi:MAG: hypothetical protein LBV18_03055 [Alistipes sp.]|jgi:hypothetical protein|nr:hypothetical protein [Alistipes sp.]